MCGLNMFWVWLILLNIMAFIRVPAKVMFIFSFTSGKEIDGVLYSFIDEHLGSFHLLSVLNT